MNIDRELYQEFLRQKNFIEALLPTDEDLHRLFFQDQVIEHLSPEEQETYMMFLLGSRPQTAHQVMGFHQFSGSSFPKSNWWQNLLGWGKSWLAGA